MTIRDDVLPILDEWRGRLDSDFGLRRFDLMLYIREWPAGTIPGAHGVSPRESATAITVGDGRRPKVVQLSAREIAASGGLYQDRDLRVGPFTPPFDGGGADPDWFRPPVSGDRKEYYVMVSNADTGEENELYKILSVDQSASLRWMMVIRKTGAI